MSLNGKLAFPQPLLSEPGQELLLQPRLFEEQDLHTGHVEYVLEYLRIVDYSAQCRGSRLQGNIHSKPSPTKIAVSYRLTVPEKKHSLLT
jgi:hypothetical protein